MHCRRMNNGLQYADGIIMKYVMCPSHLHTDSYLEARILQLEETTEEDRFLFSCLDILLSTYYCCRALSMVGLVLIAFGTGGIKPCVSAFGGDQFEDHQVQFFFFLQKSTKILLVVFTHTNV